MKQISKTLLHLISYKSKFVGSIDLEKNETKFRVERNDELTKKIFKIFWKKVIQTFL
jgi:hypothetical protein